MCPILGNGHGRIAGENRSRKPLLIVVSANYVVADANTTRLSKNLENLSKKSQDGSSAFEKSSSGYVSLRNRIICKKIALRLKFLIDQFLNF